MNSGTFLKRQSIIWLADAVRAASNLQADDRAFASINVLLGLRQPTASPHKLQPERGPWSYSTAEPASSVPQLSPPPSPQAKTTSPSDDVPDIGEVKIPPNVIHSQASYHGPPRPLPTLKEAEDGARRLVGTNRQPDSRATRYNPLFDPHTQRAILGAVAASRAPIGEVDTEALANRCARREPIRVFPRHSKPTTRRGLQLLLDIGNPMLPFARDQEVLVRSLRLVAGPDGFEALRFMGMPLGDGGAGEGPVWTWRPYRPPANGVPILVVSDFGMASHDARRVAIEVQWRRLARDLRAVGCSALGLTPWPVENASPGLRRVFPLITWDRQTTVRDAVAASRAAHRDLAGRGG
jgi:hypothetical protein